MDDYCDKTNGVYVVRILLRRTYGDTSKTLDASAPTCNGPQLFIRTPLNGPWRLWRQQLQTLPCHTLAPIPSDLGSVSGVAQFELVSATRRLASKEDV